MLLLIDNYDSFTYNLVHYLGELGAEVVVKRNDALDVQEAMAMRPDAIMLSPGPCERRWKNSRRRNPSPSLLGRLRR